METTTFKQLLADDNVFVINSILIPKIQRSYAQGRMDKRTITTRDRFLIAILEKLLTDSPLTLDFIYGYVDKGCLIPLDGQQRLTTLWLLHWYAAKKEGVETDILSKFTYNTRYSARDFIKRLSFYTPKWDGKISECIRNEGWFPLDWGNDSTVSGMLVMLDAIDERFSKIDHLWAKLDLVSFYFLPLEELCLTDEIYIKMNSRGKPLTDFEHFKAEFLKEIRNIEDSDIKETCESIANRIGRKFDIEWTDLLWNYRDKNNLIDEEFLRAFRIVCHLITYQDDRSFNEEIYKLDDFQLIKEFFSGVDAFRNLKYLEDFFDCWVDLNNSIPKGEYNNGIEAFFNDYLSVKHEKGKSLPLSLDPDDIDLFKVGLKAYPNLRNPNVLQWLTTLFAFLTYIQNRDKISEADFRRRLRIILNLQVNSGNEVVDTPKGDAGNRMPAILLQVKKILLEGIVEKNIVIDGREKPTFNVAQLIEEAEKLEFTTSNPDQAEPLFELEDHPLLEGRTVIVGYQNTHLYQKFSDLFKNCSRDAIDCAMLAVTDYSQRITNQIIQLGSGNNENPGDDAWYNLFHPTGKIKNFDLTMHALRTVLEMFDNYDDDTLYSFAEEYENECERKERFDWRYYYLHYPIFRACRYGRYTLDAESPYKLVAIHSSKYPGSKSYQCFLAELADGDMERIYDIRWLSHKDGRLYCENDRFQYLDMDGESVIDELIIPQDDGIDTVDRIVYFRENPL